MSVREKLKKLFQREPERYPLLLTLKQLVTVNEALRGWLVDSYGDHPRITVGRDAILKRVRKAVPAYQGRAQVMLTRDEMDSLVGWLEEWWHENGWGRIPGEDEVDHYETLKGDVDAALRIVEVSRG